MVCVKVAANNPEFNEGNPLEVSSSALSEAPGNEESTEMPIEKAEVDLRSDISEEKPGVEQSDDEGESKEADRDNDKVRRCTVWNQMRKHLSVFHSDA